MLQVIVMVNFMSQCGRITGFSDIWSNIIVYVLMMVFWMILTFILSFIYYLFIIHFKSPVDWIKQVALPMWWASSNLWKAWLIQKAWTFPEKERIPLALLPLNWDSRFYLAFELEFRHWLFLGHNPASLWIYHQLSWSSGLLPETGWN